MLQQTRVLTVIPYYERFLGSFPTVHALAESPLARVLEHWSGLGYYRRARMLHEGASMVVRDYNGELPTTAHELRAIRGIGAYTAGAIASIAFGREEPAVDGNVVRVVARIFGIATADPAAITAHARMLAKGRDPGLLNQALMELGATICTPRVASCDACPVRAQCRAREEGTVASIPPVRQKSIVKRWPRVAIVARRGEEILMARRKVHLVFGGLWEPPCVDRAEKRPAIHAAAALAEGIVDGKLVRARTVKHVLSHRDVRVTVFEVEDAQPKGEMSIPNDYDAIGWHGMSVAMSTLAKKIVGRR
jgi:A/G-specific adenine glycosylase